MTNISVIYPRLHLPQPQTGQVIQPSLISITCPHSGHFFCGCKLCELSTCELLLILLFSSLFSLSLITNCLSLNKSIILGWTTLTSTLSASRSRTISFLTSLSPSGTAWFGAAEPI